MQFFCFIVCAFVIALPNIIRSENNVASFTEDDMPKYCGRPHIINYAYDGTIELHSSYPWTVLIEYSRNHKTSRSRADFRCAANLIHTNYAVTAASCVFGSNLKSKPVSVQVGSLEVNAGKKKTDAVDIKIAEMFVHESYDPDSISQSDDIALLRLSRPVKDDEAMPICLPFASHLP
ncbi:serine protease 7-like [Contarinia nasturtii]|uniref:serine protease 7-like n=1 Tax=Contarinia nasturtii TaxID=265458 RepID=UPI0012D47BAC|nr:serine protease 7-like [Contarinia nasturtii]